MTLHNFLQTLDQRNIDFNFSRRVFLNYVRSKTQRIPDGSTRSFIPEINSSARLSPPGQSTRRSTTDFTLLDYIPQIFMSRKTTRAGQVSGGLKNSEITKIAGRGVKSSS